MAALALAEAIERVSSGRIAPRLKWPNDLQIDGAKLAGILLEMAADGAGRLRLADHGHRRQCRLGAPGRSALSRHLPDRPGLAAPRRGGCWRRLSATLRPRLDRWERDGFAALREDWLARAAGRGSPAALRIGDRAVHGKLVDVDIAGALRLEQADGTVATFTAGEIVLG